MACGIFKLTRGRLLGAGLIVSVTMIPGCGGSDTSWRPGPSQPIAIAPPATLPTLAASPITPPILPAAESRPPEPVKAPMAIRPVYESNTTAPTALRAQPQIDNLPNVAAVAASSVGQLAQPASAMVAVGEVPPGSASRLSPMAASHASNHIRQGFDLGQRGAFFTARAEFVQALRTVAQAHDADEMTKVHVHALNSGLVAIEEIEDLAPRSKPSSTGLEVPVIARSHRTPRSGRIEPQGLTSDELRDKYVDHAAGQFAMAVGPEPVAAEALYGLAKIYATLGSQEGKLSVGADAKSMAFYRATLLAAPQHAIAANDLAVLLAKSGRYTEARELLTVSLQTNSHPAVWHNLAIVMKQMGDNDGAALAERSMQLAGGGTTPAAEQTAQVMQSIAFTNSMVYPAQTGNRPIPSSSMPSAAPSSMATTKPGRFLQQAAAIFKAPSAVFAAKSETPSEPASNVRMVERPKANSWQQ
ncbi:MAG TPA: hypothetical protein VHV77_00055 [Pirellulales bacterium]|nr:hypothetical protein [Pirellulales bacterium]